MSSSSLRILWAFGIGGLLAAGCASESPPPPPPPPPTPPPPVADAPPPPPPPPPLFVAALRGVETEAVNKDALVKASDRLWSDLSGTARRLEANEGCVEESCQIEAASAQSASHVLHPRLVQYEGNCLLLGVLYAVDTRQSDWGFTSKFPCSAEAVLKGVGDLAEAMKSRTPPSTPRTVHAVVPLQHTMKDLTYASESFGEYLTTVLAESGMATVPASIVAHPLIERNAALNTGCSGKICPLELGGTAKAQLSVATVLKKKGKGCEIELKVYDVATKKSPLTSKSQGGCAAHEIAETLRIVSAKLVSTPPPPPPPPPTDAPPPPAETPPPPPPPAESTPPPPPPPEPQPVSPPPPAETPPPSPPPPSETPPVSPPPPTETPPVPPPPAEEKKDEKKDEKKEDNLKSGDFKPGVLPEKKEEGDDLK